MITICSEVKALCYSRDAARSCANTAAVLLAPCCTFQLPRQRIIEACNKTPFRRQYVAAELQAREHRDNHDFGEAASSARSSRGHCHGRRRPGVLVEYDVLPGRMPSRRRRVRAVRSFAAQLVSAPLVGGGAAPGEGQNYVGKGVAGSGSSRTGAADEAREAAELVTDEADIEINVNARLALVAAWAKAARWMKPGPRALSSPTSFRLKWMISCWARPTGSSAMQHSSAAV